MLLALGGLYLEVQTPGFGMPGIVGVISLALLLGSHFILGLTDVMDVVLIAAGASLLAIELLVLPGFGLAGAAGIVLLGAGLYLSLVDFTIPTFSWHFERLGEAAYSMGLAFVLLTILMILSWRFLPQSPFFRRLVLEETQAPSRGYIATAPSDTLIGLHGVAVSMLRPAGRGRFDGKTLQIVTRGEFIDAGTPVMIVETEGNRFVVESVGAEQG